MLKDAFEIYSINFAHLYFLVLAETEKLKNNFLKAIFYYDQAIEKAKTNHFPHIAAISNECAGRCCLQTNSKLALGYFQEAHYYYTIWGATLKAKQLESEFPDLFRVREANVITSSTATSSTANLDLLSIIKSTQAISGEIILEKLFSQLIKVVLENAGAQRCILVSAQGEVIAEGCFHENKHTFNFGDQQKNDLPASVLSYVIRTKESVIVDDVSLDERFTKDEYFTRIPVKSMLCFPIKFHKEIDAYLYLENTLTVGAFTQRRIQALEILAAQAAISIENAQFYSKLERKVADQTESYKIR